MSHSGRCRHHLRHWPRVMDVQVHHILPLAEGGPDTRDNRTDLCGTGHDTVHRMLRAIKKAGGNLPDAEARRLRRADRAAWRLALEGWRRMQAGQSDGLPE